MTGIERYGAYIPLYRLRREEIARAWGEAAPGGEKAVANFDEDAVTMAVAAALDCLGDEDPGSIDALYFATTTSPYREKQAAATIAAALNLPRRAATIDFTDSLRSGTLALKAALDAVRAGSARRVLVAAADCRLGAPRSEFEQLFGDGAAALLIGTENVAAEIDAWYTHTDEFLDIWRTKGEEFVRSWEDRFILTEGYALNLREGMRNFLASQNLSAKDFHRVVYYAPDARRHREMAAALGFDYRAQVQDPLFDSLGNTGCAFALMLLVAALEEAREGMKLLLANYGDGCDILSLTTTPLVERGRGRRGIKGHLASKRYLPSYEKYITYRQLMFTEPPRRPPFVSFPPVLWRDRKWVLGFNGSRCLNCGRLFFPPQRICLYCRSKDNFEYIPLARRRGILYTFTKDNLALTVDSPEIFALVHLEGGVRVYCRMTDRDPDRIEVEMPVEMTFRKFHEAGGYPNYFWKCMPVR